MHSSSGSICKPSNTHQHAQRPQLSTTAQEVGAVQHTHPTGGGLLVWPAAAAAKLMTAAPRLIAIGPPSLLPSAAHGCVEPGQAPPVMCAMACRCWCNMLFSHWPGPTPHPGHLSVSNSTSHTPTLPVCLPACLLAPGCSCGLWRKRRGCKRPPRGAGDTLLWSPLAACMPTAGNLQPGQDMCRGLVSNIPRHRTSPCHASK